MSKTINEANFGRKLQMTAAKISVWLFRNNVGKAWVGKHYVCTEPKTVTLQPGDVVIKQARFFHAGLALGSSDFIGWTPVKILQSHVGQTLAVFTSVETKAQRGKLSDEQTTWLANVEQVGGIAVMAKSDEDLFKAVNIKRGPNGV